MAAALAVVIAYLLGSIDFGVIVARARSVDIYREGRALLVLVQHAPNIRRLVGGRERRMDAA